jgi:hypothetical protein
MYLIENARRGGRNSGERKCHWTALDQLDLWLFHTVTSSVHTKHN